MMSTTGRRIGAALFGVAVLAGLTGCETPSRVGNRSTWYTPTQGVSHYRTTMLENGTNRIAVRGISRPDDSSQPAVIGLDCRYSTQRRGATPESLVILHDGTRTRLPAHFDFDSGFDVESRWTGYDIETTYHYTFHVVFVDPELQELALNPMGVLMAAESDELAAKAQAAIQNPVDEELVQTIIGADTVSFHVDAGHFDITLGALDEVSRQYLLDALRWYKQEIPEFP